MEISDLDHNKIAAWKFHMEGSGAETPYNVIMGRYPLDLLECGHPVLKAQLQPFHGRGEPAWSFPEVTLYLPWDQDTPTPASSRTSDEDAGVHYTQRWSSVSDDVVYV